MYDVYMRKCPLYGHLGHTSDCSTLLCVRDSQSEEGLVIVEEPNELQTKNELWGYTKIKYKINKDFCNCE